MKIRDWRVWIRDAGGGLTGQNVTFYKVVFKIHFKPVILERKNLVENLTFLRVKIFFLQKCPNIGLVSLKNTCIFRYIRKGGVRQTNVTFFFFEVVP